MFVRVFRTRSLPKRSGTCLNESGMFFESNSHMEMGKTIGQSISSEHFGILQLWEFLCQPFGENAFSKKCTQKKHEQYKKKVFEATKLQLGVGAGGFINPTQDIQTRTYLIHL